MNSTINYYNQNAQEYALKVSGANMSADLNTLIEGLPKSSEIKLLEIGAGGGRDLKYMRDRGFNVLPLEPSTELANLIEKEQGVKVVRQKVQEMSYENEFDGVYAIASLLHIPKNEILDVLKKINTSLKENGVFLLTLKEGVGESLDNQNRFFSYYAVDEIKEILEEAGFNNISFNKNNDMLNRADTQWITTMCSKPTLVLNSKPSPKKRF